VAVLGIAFTISILAIVALNLMTQEARIAEHKIHRIRASFAARAGIVDVLERLRRGLGILPAPPAVFAGTSYWLDTPPVTAPPTPGRQVNGYNPIVVVVPRGANFVAPQNGRTYTCAAGSPSPYCVFTTVENY
jgi:hypothetical protein